LVLHDDDNPDLLCCSAERRHQLRPRSPPRQRPSAACVRRTGSLETRIANWQDEIIVSPTIFQRGPYRFFFFSSDRSEPPHVHVMRERRLAKFWLGPIRLATCVGFGKREVELVDGRVVSVPTAWYPRLAEASSRERRSWVLIGSGIGIHWRALDEDISVEGLLRGERSGESPTSLRSWRAGRKRPANKALQPTGRAPRTGLSQGAAARG
jgi:hypothetical protein